MRGVGRMAAGVAIALAIAAASRGADGVEAPGLVRVMSFNIRYGTAKDGPNAWGHRREQVVDVIRSFAPDLLGCQEVLSFQRDELAAALDGYEVVGVGRDDGLEEGEMTPIFFRLDRFERLDSGHFWLSSTPATVGSKGWDAALPRIATWARLRDRDDAAQSEVLVLNTHFDHRGAQARLESARLVRRMVGDLGRDGRLVLMGDFNAEENSPPYEALFSDSEQGPCIVDTWRARGPRPAEREGTFNGFDPAAVDGPRIDWIGCSHDWNVRLAGIDRTVVDGRTPSDHWPVTAVLRPSASPGRATLRVLTYNIHHGRGTDGVIDLARIARVMRDADPDLVALQEVDERTTRSEGVDEAGELARLTGLTVRFGPQIDYLGGRYGQAILSRFPLGEAIVHELPGIGGDRERRIAVAVEAATPFGPIVMAGTHLHHRSEEARREQARAIVKALANAEHCILAGDINAVPGSEPITVLDAAWTRATVADAPTQATFPAGAPARAIDHVFVRPSGAWRVVGMEVLDEPEASDHRPVVVVLEPTE